MKTRIFRLAAFGGCLILASSLYAQTAGSSPLVSQEAESYYQQALSAYLDGNYDQAIVLAAKSLEKEPSYQKSKNLLSVLTSEKEMEGKTVIWIGGKPAVVTATPVLSAPTAQDSLVLQKEVQDLKAHSNNFFVSQSRKNTVLNGQIQVIQELVKNNSGAQYAEFTKSQGEITKQLEKIITTSGQDLRILYLLCFTSVLFSFVALWKRPRK